MPAWHERWNAKRRVYPPAMITTRQIVIVMCLAAAGTDHPGPQTTAVPQQTPATRRSQRLNMPQVEVVSPDGTVRFTLLPNAERLTFTVARQNTTVIDPSPIVLTVDGYDLSASLIMSGVVRDEVKESYPWSGAAEHRRQSRQPRNAVADERLDVGGVHAGSSRVQRWRRVPTHHSRWRSDVAGSRRGLDIQSAGRLDGLVRRDGGPLRSALSEKRCRCGAAGRMGGSTPDVQASTERRLRRDH